MSRPSFTDEQLIAALQSYRPTGCFTYVIRNVLVSAIGASRSQIPVSTVRRRLQRLEREGRVTCKRWGPGCANEWSIVP